METKLADLPEVLTVEEARKILRIGRNLAYRMAADGRLPTISAGRKRLVPKPALQALLARGGSEPSQKA